MSWKSEANKIYEGRVLNDALSRLAERLDVAGLPFSDVELKTLAKRHRESVWNSVKKRERLDRYKAHLAKTYGMDVVSRVSSLLEAINNEIGYEEK